MENFLYSSLIIIIPLIISKAFYIQMDLRYKLTYKICSIFNLKKKTKKHLFVIGFIFFNMLLITALDIYVIRISQVTFSVLTGIFMGLGFSFSSKSNSRIIR